MTVVGTRPATTARYSPLLVLGSAGKSTPKPYCGYLKSFHAALAGPAATKRAAMAKAVKRIRVSPTRMPVLGRVSRSPQIGTKTSTCLRPMVIGARAGGVPLAGLWTPQYHALPEPSRANHPWEKRMNFKSLGLALFATAAV